MSSGRLSIVRRLGGTPFEERARNDGVSEVTNSFALEPSETFVVQDTAGELFQ